ncbi:RNA polymerase sigma factor [Kineosporia succinea]|uniref:RNA polymerase sigma-70 factor (ECF subfamily) n=1 Tax=Kineosporia succinea TaxID=84632 RepID=A0ABT9PC64_9ACTN|nr:RNA polymerase sigma factor [Kineosporia succinea]MDP9830287.1 RNA polymerase sigma-70 factor (ECF subfamily) [Kineosporia succinea]
MGPAEQRFRAMYAATYEDLSRFVRRRVPPSDAEDIVATVFAVAWRRLDDVPDQHERPWLFGVARNVMAGQSRWRLRHGVVDVRMVVAVDPAPEPDGAVGVAARIDLVRAWWTLSAADREVLALVAFDGLSEAEAAEVLGCRRSTFRMRLSRSRRRLRSALGPAEPAPALEHLGSES